MEAFDETFFTQGEDVVVSPDNSMSFASDLQSSSFTAVNEGSPTGTISPTDLSLQPDLTMSAPSSTAFPNLNTPGSHVLDSPYWGHASSSLDTSPWQGDGQLDASLEGVDWNDKPLFDLSNDPFAQPMAAQNLASSTVVAAASPMVRQGSSGSPRTERKHSSVAGVKPTKSRKPLPDIVIADEDDKETAKRKKNTAAARKSRERRNNNMLEQAEIIEKLSADIEAKEVVIDEQVAMIKKLQTYITSLGGNPTDAASLF